MLYTSVKPGRKKNGNTILFWYTIPKNTALFGCGAVNLMFIKIKKKMYTHKKKLIRISSNFPTSLFLPQKLFFFLLFFFKIKVVFLKNTSSAPNLVYFHPNGKTPEPHTHKRQLHFFHQCFFRDTKMFSTSQFFLFYLSFFFIIRKFT